MIRGHGEEIKDRKGSGKFLVLVGFLLLLIFGALAYIAFSYLSGAIAQAQEVDTTKLERFSAKIDIDEYDKLVPQIDQLKLYSP